MEVLFSTDTRENITAGSSTRKIEREMQYLSKCYKNTVKEGWYRVPPNATRRRLEIQSTDLIC